MEIELIEGGLHVDERGIVCFCNDFNLEGVARFYTIRSHETRRPRGWIGHRRDHKWFTALTGSVLIGVVAPDDWKTPSKSLPIERYTLSHLKPSVLHVPPGHATASIMLTNDALLGIFSSGQIENAAEDDWRFPKDTWAIIDPVFYEI
jgi:dTDP-4-dehydrorhamnose 3,5-epimerase-like enzyme